MSSTHSIRHLIALAVCLSLAACGGGGGSSGSPGDPGSPGNPGNPGNPGGPSGPDGPAATFAVGGTVGGLDGTVVLQNNGGDDLPISTNGAFRFATAIVGGGTPYRVTVKTQPELQTCVVTNESGNVNAAAITNVQITCALATFSVAGSVNGLAGSGLVLQNNGRDDVTVDASGAQTFRFATPVAGGERYSVTVLKQPVDPVQKCSVASGEGTAKNTSVPQPIVTCASSFSRFAYVANFDTDTLSVNSIDSVTGQLRHRSYVSTGDNPSAVAVDAGNKWVAVTNALAPSVSLFEINRSDGSLTLRSETPTGLFPSSVAIDPARQFAYVTNFAANSVSSYRIESDGRMTEENPIARVQTENGPNAVAIDRSLPVVYVVNFASDSISAYTVNVATSALTHLSTKSTGTHPIHITFDSADRFMYVVNQGSGDVSIFGKPDLSTAAWPELPDSPFGVGPNPSNLAFDPSGRFAFVVGDNTLQTLILATDGISVPTTSPFSVAVSPGKHAVSTDGLGKFVFVTHQDSGQVDVFLLNSETGQLKRVSRAASRGSPAAIAVSAGSSPVKDVSKFAYVLNSNATVSTFPFDSVAGLRRKIEPDASTAPSPKAIALDPRGRFAYVTNVADTVSRFSIDGATGVLAQQLPIVPAGSVPSAIAVDMLGRFAYVTNLGTRNGWRFAIDATSGDLSAPIVFPASFSPSSIALDPTGRFAYVANTGGASTFPYVIDPATGALNQRTQFTTATSPRAVVVDPSGRFVFEVGAHPTDNLNSYVIDPLTSELTDVGGAVRVGAQAVALAVAPSGRFLYTVNEDAGHASIFKVAIDTENGVLSDVREFPLSPAIVPSRIAIDASGSFLYVTEGDAGVEIFRIDPETGDLDEERVGQFSTGSPAISIVISSAIQ